MAARTGMANLIKRLRVITHIGTADFTVNSVAYYSDDFVEDTLDTYRMDINRRPIQPIVEYNGGTAQYFTYYLGYGNLEEPTSGDQYFQIEDSDGANVGTANYTLDPLAGVVRFSADQGGTAYYLTARSYNLNRAAADIFREKASWAAEGYDFAADQQRFNRSQKYRHYKELAAEYDKKGGVMSVQMVRSDLL